MSYGKFGFSKADIDGNKPANGICLPKKQDIKKCLSSSTESRQFEFKLVLITSIFIVAELFTLSMHAPEGYSGHLVYRSLNIGCQ